MNSQWIVAYYHSLSNLLIISKLYIKMNKWIEKWKNLQDSLCSITYFQYKMKDSLDVVMEALHQDMFFQTTYIANQEYYLSAVLYQLGNDQLDTLGKFLYEDGLIPMGKHIVFDAIIMTALHQPQQRLTALHIASD